MRFAGSSAARTGRWLAVSGYRMRYPRAERVKEGAARGFRDAGATLHSCHEC